MVDLIVAVNGGVDEESDFLISQSYQTFIEETPSSISHITTNSIIATSATYRDPYDYRY
jgi:hypothetical protein